MDSAVSVSIDVFFPAFEIFAPLSARSRAVESTAPFDEVVVNVAEAMAHRSTSACSAEYRVSVFERELVNDSCQNNCFLTLHFEGTPEEARERFGFGMHD